MTKNALVFLAAALALLPGLGRASAQAAEKEQAEPFLYSQDFESGTDPVRFWTSYKKKYTVDFAGVTDEKAHSGKRSFKLDVTFDEASRFLWHVPMAKKVAAGGKLEFSGHMLLGEGSTAEATLGVSFALPPMGHTGCTAWGPLLRSTDGQWKLLRDDLVKRGEETAHVIATRDNWGVQGENVGAVVERIILDVRAKAGQRVVLYVDDLEIRGSVSSEEAYREEIKRRWAPVEARIEQKVSLWEAALREAEEKLAALTDLSPVAEAMRREMAVKLQGVKTKIADAKGRTEIRTREQQEIDPFLEHMKKVPATIRAVSGAEKKGQRAIVYVVPPISELMILPDDRY